MVMDVKRHSTTHLPSRAASTKILRCASGSGLATLCPFLCSCKAETVATAGGYTEFRLCGRTTGGGGEGRRGWGGGDGGRRGSRLSRVHGRSVRLSTSRLRQSGPLSCKWPRLAYVRRFLTHKSWKRTLFIVTKKKKKKNATKNK